MNINIDELYETANKLFDVIADDEIKADKEKNALENELKNIKEKNNKAVSRLQAELEKMKNDLGELKHE